jgi:ligand-binding sensor domain-containing protein
MTAGGNLFWEVEGEFREPSDWRRSGTTVPPRTLFDALSHVTTLLITGGRPATSDAAWSQARSLIYVGTASRGLHIVANRGSGELEVLRGEQDGVSVYVRERATIRSLANHPSRPGVLCVGTNRGLYASTDAGQSWFRLGQALRFEEVLSLLFDPQRGAIYVGLAAGGVWYTVDNGANWQPLADGLGRSAVLSLALDSGDSGTLYAGTDSGLWRLSLSPDGLEG